MAWSVRLYGLIPEERLDECFNKAYADHKPGYLMECAELIQAWRRIRDGTGPPATAECILCVAHRDSPNEVRPCAYHFSPDNILDL